MRNLPSGTATFLFTDIEGSTKLWESVPEKMQAALQRHHEILRFAIESQGGVVFQIVGDAFCAAFPRAPSALCAAAQAQRELFKMEWDLPVPIRVRMGIHTGLAEPMLSDAPTGGYTSNQTLNRVSRIMSAGHGGQILLSLAAEELSRDFLPPNSSLQDLGEHHLRDVIHPEHLFQLNISDLPSEFPPLETLRPPRHNLPVQLTDFIGREKELAEIDHALAQNRLVTIVGAGGSGKTRLAIEAGAAQAICEQADHQFSNGVYFVTLAPLDSIDAIVPKIAFGLGFSFYAGNDPHQQLLDYLHEKSLLLILDNFEHLLPGAGLVREILNTAPGVKILVTSRIRLNLEGEQLFHLTGMDFPNWESPQDAAEYSAVQLFHQTAHRVCPAFELTKENLRYVVRLCRLLDGMPLGILLAASWMEMLSADEIVGEIEKSLDFLETRQCDLPERQHSMRAVFDYSWSLLTRREKDAFMKASVFRGGFTRQAAQQVTGVALRELLGLVDKSLLQRNPGERYQIHELLRQYGEEKLLRSGEQKSVRDCHRDYFLALMEQAMPELHRETQLLWLERLDQELDNLRAGMSWSLEQGEAETALRLSGALGEYWIIRGYESEARAWYERSLSVSDRIENLQHSKYRARVLLYLGSIVVDNWDYSKIDDALLNLQEALEIYRGLDDKVNITLIMIELSSIRRRINADEAISILEDAVSIARDSGDRFILALALDFLAINLASKEKDRSRALLEECLENLQIAGDRWLKAMVLDNLAISDITQGEVNRARSLLEEGLSISQQIKTPYAVSYAQRNLGWLAYEQGRYEDARVYIEDALSLSYEFSLKNGIVYCLWHLAQLLFYQEDFEQALIRCQDAIQRCIDMQFASEKCLFEIATGFIYLAKNDYAKAYTLFAENGKSVLEGFTNLEGAIVFRGWGDAARHLGNLRESLDHYRRGIALVQKMNQAFILEHLLEGTAKTFCEMRMPERAVRLFGAATSIRKRWEGVIHPVFRAEYDKYIALLRERLGGTAFESLWAKGQSLSFEDAIELALQEEKPE